ncbi:hypothetical protein T492DRAFT_230993 [Pavlovales sp. CCMP2436]|nr:hypothetical protein T492DRAFT_230993 [Pavlovales sp. CCMP2436]
MATGCLIVFCSAHLALAAGVLRSPPRCPVNVQCYAQPNELPRYRGLGFLRATIGESNGMARPNAVNNAARDSAVACGQETFALAQLVLDLEGQFETEGSQALVVARATGAQAEDCVCARMGSRRAFCRPQCSRNPRQNDSNSTDARLEAPVKSAVLTPLGNAVSSLPVV